MQKRILTWVRAKARLTFSKVFTGAPKRIISLLAATNEISTLEASTAAGAEADFLFGISIALKQHDVCVSVCVCTRVCMPACAPPPHVSSERGKLKRLKSATRGKWAVSPGGASLWKYTRELRISPHRMTGAKFGLFALTLQINDVV